MKKALSRFILLLLIPCLVMDPAVADSVSAVYQTPTFSTHPGAGVFNDQAFIQRLIAAFRGRSTFDRQDSVGIVQHTLELPGRLERPALGALLFFSVILLAQENSALHMLGSGIILMAATQNSSRRPRKTLLQKLGFDGRISALWVEQVMSQRKGVGPVHISLTPRLFRDAQDHLFLIFRESSVTTEYMRTVNGLWLYEVFSVSQTGDIEIIPFPANQPRLPTEMEIGSSLEALGRKPAISGRITWNDRPESTERRRFEFSLKYYRPGDTLELKHIGGPEVMASVYPTIQRKIKAAGFERYLEDPTQFKFIRLPTRGGIIQNKLFSGLIFILGLGTLALLWVQKLIPTEALLWNATLIGGIFSAMPVKRPFLPPRDFPKPRKTPAEDSDAPEIDYSEDPLPDWVPPPYRIPPTPYPPSPQPWYTRDFLRSS